MRRRPDPSRRDLSVMNPPHPLKLGVPTRFWSGRRYALTEPATAAVAATREPSLRYSPTVNLQRIAPVIVLGFPSSSKSNALLLQTRLPAIVSAATTIGPRLALRCTPPLMVLRSSATVGGPPEAPGPVLFIWTCPLMTSPPQSNSSAPKIRVAAPFAMNPPLIVEAHTNSIPPSLTRTPPDMFAPPRTQKSPALTTKPPTTVPESGGLGAGPVLHSVAASA